jgi:hypothetical protein
MTRDLLLATSSGGLDYQNLCVVAGAAVGPHNFYARRSRGPVTKSGSATRFGWLRGTAFGSSSSNGRITTHTSSRERLCSRFSSRALCLPPGCANVLFQNGAPALRAGQDARISSNAAGSHRHLHPQYSANSLLRLWTKALERARCCCDSGIKVNLPSRTFTGLGSSPSPGLLKVRRHVRRLNHSSGRGID